MRLLLSAIPEQFRATTLTPAVRAFGNVSRSSLLRLLVTHRGVLACEVGKSGSTKRRQQIKRAVTVLQRTFITTTGMPSHSVATLPDFVHASTMIEAVYHGARSNATTPVHDSDSEDGLRCDTSDEEFAFAARRPRRRVRRRVIPDTVQEPAETQQAFYQLIVTGRQGPRADAAPSAIPRPDGVSPWGEPLYTAWQDRPTGRQLADFEHDVNVALHAFWSASGNGRETDAPDRGLAARIGEPLPDQERFHLLRDACAVTDPYQRIVGCASCGERAVGRENAEYVRVPLSQPVIARVFRASDDCLAREAATPPQLRPALNIYRPPSDLGLDLPPLMLYQQYVCDGRATMCARCHGTLTEPSRRRPADDVNVNDDDDDDDDDDPVPAAPANAPRYSLAAGVNFGDYAALNSPMLSQAEVLCIAQARPFVGHMKVSPTGGHRWHGHAQEPPLHMTPPRAVRVRHCLATSGRHLALAT